jgi:TolB-like protein/Tfp pilus assembly protein PilF
MALNWFKNIFENKRSVSEIKIFSENTTLAVLPFKNQTYKSELDYFSDGIAEEIINYLSAMPGLTVISRNSTKSFNKFQDLHEIVQKATLGKVVQGNIERSEGKLKLNVELIDFNDHHTLWSNNYDTEIDKTRVVIDDIIKNVLNALNFHEKSEESPERRTIIDFDVYDLYLKGRYSFNQREEGLSVGRDLFNQCIKTDPTYAPAYAGLSQCYNLLGFYEFKKPVEVYPKAKEAALKALEIDKSLVEAHTSLAFVHTLYEWDWKSAEKGFLLALELNPGYATAHHWYAEFLMATGRFEEGIQQSRKAQKFDPVGLIINTLLGMAYFLSGDFDRSIAECKKTLLMAHDYLPVYIWLGLSYCKKEMYDEAIKLFEKGRAISKNKNTKLTSLLAYSYAASGKSEAAESILNELDLIAKFGYVSPMERAGVAVAGGDVDLALKYLEDAVDGRATGLSWINVNPIFDNLRSQSRFSEIIKKMNFPNE